MQPRRIVGGPNSVKPQVTYLACSDQFLLFILLLVSFLARLLNLSRLSLTIRLLKIWSFSASAVQSLGT
jgi:hypothetical protein